MADKIEQYFGDGSEFGLAFRYAVEEKLQGTGGALKNAGNMLADEFILINGDTFLPIDYLDLVDQFHQHDTISTISVCNNPDIIVRNNIAIDKSGLVSKYSKKDSNGMRYVDAGVIVFKKEVLDFIPEQHFCSLEEEIFPTLINRKEMKPYITGQRFYDMGTIEGMKALEGVLR